MIQLTYGNKLPKKGQTIRSVIEEQLAERGIEHGGVRWKNVDPNKPDDPTRGWLIRLSGKWVRVGRSLSDVMRYLEKLP